MLTSKPDTLSLDPQSYIKLDTAAQVSNPRVPLWENGRWRQENESPEALRSASLADAAVNKRLGTSLL